MRTKAFLLTAISALVLSFAACSGTATNSNYNANANLAGPRTASPQPTATQTPKYTAAQATGEPEPAKQKKETVRDTIEDASVQTKTGAKPTAATKAPERNLKGDE